MNLQPGDAELSIHDAVTGNALQSLDFDAFDFNGEGSRSVGDGTNLQDLTLSADGRSLVTIVKVSFAADPAATQYSQRIWQLDDNGHFILTSTSQLFSAGKASDIFADMVFTNSGFFNCLTGNTGDYIGGGNQLTTTNFQISVIAVIARTVLPDSDRTDFFTRLSPDGEYYFASGSVAGSRLGNVITGEVQNIGGEDLDTAAMFSRNGDYLAVASPQKVRIFSKRL